MEQQLTLSSELHIAVSRLAEQYGTDIQELINQAVREYLDRAAEEKILAEARAFRAMQADLLARYKDQYVAVHNGQVIDCDSDLRALYLRVHGRLGRTPVLLKRVTAEPERDLVIRSPKLERGS